MGYRNVLETPHHLGLDIEEMFIDHAVPRRTADFRVRTLLEAAIGVGRTIRPGPASPPTDRRRSSTAGAPESSAR